MVTEKLQSAFGALKDRFGYTNIWQAPRLVKIVVSVGAGRVSKDEKRLALIADRLAKITGQKAAPRAAKKAIASFKSRQGDIVGYQVTLRGRRARDFLTRLISIALPRTRDFRGVARSSVDEMGNCTVGISEHIIFPESADEESRDIFGFAATIVTTAHTRDEALAFLEHLGMPFTK
ncbi:MAG: 50S ribosomal protein L5 [bacterium]|nr:50S ribosomal protein L5 [bacterium]MDZ4285214.1 50S ribosomal protein L5 [Patescibacteria group bacterium]